MANFNAQQVFEKISASRLLPLFNVPDVQVCEAVIDQCYTAGLRVFELTNRDSQAMDTFRLLCSRRNDRWPGLALGAGTVLDAGTARRFIELGADFIVAPDLNPEVGEICIELGVPWIPGCLSPTEISMAYRIGASMVKLFPAGAVGPAYIRHIHGPMPFAKIIVTGGVSPDAGSLKGWLDAGAYAIGLGSSLFTAARISSGAFGEIGEELRDIVGLTSAHNRS
jgi:2-dehydro-3-deoxyphosphogluconate aldolase / (4S)-4-hydroxy-2-oxoglutarate aldolase